MDFRRVIKIKGSYYVNIPIKTGEAFGLKKGQRVKVVDVPGSGIFITHSSVSENFPVNIESVERLQKVSAEILSRHEKRLKDLAEDFISKFMLRLVPVMASSGVFELKKKVSRLEKESEKLKTGKGKLSLVRKIK